MSDRARCNQPESGSDPKALLDRVETWPQAEQDELARVARGIDADIKATYDATPDEIAGIDRGLKAATEGRFATDEQVATVLARRRPA